MQAYGDCLQYPEPLNPRTAKPTGSVSLATNVTLLKLRTANYKTQLAELKP